MKKLCALLVICLFAALTLPVMATERQLVKHVVINASANDVWQAWTTSAGIESFFAPKAKVDLRTNGTFEVYFAPDNPPGQRGAEGTIVLAVEPGRRIAFTWDAPGTWPEIRGKRTFVDVTLSPGEGNTTRLRLRHLGWGDGQDWNEVADYFDGAWDAVLRRLQYRFDNGPLDWNNLPDDLWYRG